MVTKISREPRELPWQPNLGKNKPKLHEFQFCTRYDEISMHMIGFGGCRTQLQLLNSSDGVGWTANTVRAVHSYAMMSTSGGY